jgi:cold-inducible RNA-binding protein
MKSIYVGNLSFGTTVEALRSLFEPYGTVDRVKAVTNRGSGQIKGYGFIEMPNDAEAEKAIVAVNGRDIGGRVVTVKEARPQKSGPSGGSGRRPDKKDRSRNAAPKPFPNRQVLT